MAQLIEAERKYALTTGQELPDLAAVITPGPVGEFELTATYYDAPDLRLTRAWQVIRHRVGGADAGWHLKKCPYFKLVQSSGILTRRFTIQVPDLISGIYPNRNGI